MGYHTGMNGAGGQPHIPPDAVSCRHTPSPQAVVAASPVLDTRPSSSLFTKPSAFVEGFVMLTFMSREN